MTPLSGGPPRTFVHDGRGACDGVTTAHGGHSRRVAMRLLLALAALCAGVSATSQDSEAREVARVAADAIAHAATGSFAETPGRALGAGKCCGRAAKHVM